MDKKVSWIVNGRLTQFLPAEINSGLSENELILRGGIIKLIETRDGVTALWSVFSANWASLYYLMEWVKVSTGPFTLKFFLSGWFNETVETSQEASDRISQIMAKSDVHIMSHTYVKEVSPERTRVPHILRDVLKDMVAPPDISIDCAPNEGSGQFVVERIGTGSTIARRWGMNPVSYPCLSGHSYAKLIEQAYEDVIRTEIPHYDHVLAAMTQPDSSIMWIPYQRVVLPHRFPDGRKGVSVVTEITDVDISIV